MPEFDIIRGTALAREGWRDVGSGSALESICIVLFVSASFHHLFVAQPAGKFWLEAAGFAVGAGGVVAWVIG
jgi:hypothetical protein